MPKQISIEEFERIVAVVAGHPEGIRRSELVAALGEDLSDRTIQRRLNNLVKKGRLVPEGQGPARRYRVPPERLLPVRPIGSAKLVREGREESPIPLSSEGLFLRDQLGQSMATRQPVGYRAEFLHAYEPNKTYYLSQENRRRLKEMGTPKSVVDAETHLKQIFHRLLIDLSWSSSRLEGNTYSLLDTQILIDAGREAEGHDAQEAHMILNHKAAIELLVDPSVEIGFNRYTICNLHALLSENLLREPAACGRLRSRGVAISGSLFQPLNVPQQIEDDFDFLLDTASAIRDPFEQAFFVMVHLPYLQPFEDVNKRVSRLAANLPLIQANLCPLSYIDMPTDEYTKAVLSVYELNRVEYLRDLFLWAYERSARRYSLVQEELGEPDTFRLEHRILIREVVSEIVKKALSSDAAAPCIQMYADRISIENRLRFIEVVEMELMQLHEGNIARFKLRPSEYRVWKAQWDPS